MKKIFRYSAYILAAAAGLSLQSCDLGLAADIPLVELGAPTKDYVIDADASSVEIDVYSNGPFHVEFTEGDNEWITLSDMKGDGDCKLTAECSFNEEFKRKAGIVLCSDLDERRDTVYVKQKGLIEAVLSLANTSVIVPGAGGLHEQPVTTNVPYEYMDVNIEYSDEENAGWISATSVEADPLGGESGTMCITTDPNTDEEALRTAAVTFSFTDGWGDRVAVQINLIQKNAKETLGNAISFTELKGRYADKTIKDYVLLEGIVVSNTESGNAGDNEQLTTSTIDYKVCEKTVYLESLDGQDGVMIITPTPEDNVFKQFDKVQILLNGATLKMKEQPERYELSGVVKSMVMSQIVGSKADVPVKEKSISELTDRDIYTYVKLTDVEFPIRKGAISPVNEGYSTGTGAHRITKYPLLVRGRDGKSMYMYTNTVCKYRNDGTMLPYGSGKISGVIVHERFPRFDWRQGADPADMDDDVTLGNIGDYQIRHQCKDDIWAEMNKSVEDSFSALLCEYRFWNPDSDEKVQRPTYGENGWLDHTYCEKYTGSASKQYLQATYKQHMWGGGTYDYLGPMGNNKNYMFGDNWGNHNGVGIVLDMTKEHYNTKMDDVVSHNPDGSVEWAGPNAKSTDVVNNSARGAGGINNQSTSMCGKSNAYGGCFLSFANHFWWDYETNRFYSWLINFSTKGISTDHLSMQIYVMNTQQTWYSPRFWTAEWSYTDSQAPEDDDQWHTIGNYTIPDVSVWANTLYSSIVAFKGINFDLPLEILDKENVYIRLHPVSDVCSDGADYANAILSGSPKAGTNNEDHASNLSYFAIRYNK